MPPRHLRRRGVYLKENALHFVPILRRRGGGVSAACFPIVCLFPACIHGGGFRRPCGGLHRRRLRFLHTGRVHIVVDRYRRRIVAVASARFPIMCLCLLRRLCFHSSAVALRLRRRLYSVDKVRFMSAALCASAFHGFGLLRRFTASAVALFG